MNRTKKIYLISLVIATVLLLMVYFNQGTVSKDFFEGTLVKIQGLCKL